MKTNKLCVIDLEGLTESACGAGSPESPTDQKLLPGVKDAIEAGFAFMSIQEWINGQP